MESLLIFTSREQLTIGEKNHLRNACAVLLALFGAAPATDAAPRCKVTDPTGAPLNRRDSHKHIIGTRASGRRVFAPRDGFDDAGTDSSLQPGIYPS
jgi:hypothetical protein